MALGRGKIRVVVQHDGSSGAFDPGAPVSGASVRIREPGTTTDLAQTLYTTATGAVAASNPLTTDSLGRAECWIDRPQRVKISVSGTGITAYDVDYQVVPGDPDNSWDEFHVGRFGAANDGSSDESAAIQAAIDAAEAAGGGRVCGDYGTSYKHFTPLTVTGDGVYLDFGPGAPSNDDNNPHAALIYTGFGTHGAPAIRFGNSASVTPTYTGIRNTVLQADPVISSASTWEGTSTGAHVAFDRVGCGVVENCRLIAPYDGVLMGTDNNPGGTTTLVMTDNEVDGYKRYGVNIRGGGHCFISNYGRAAWGAADATATAAVNIGGAGSGGNHLDGWNIEGLLTERGDYGVRIAHSAGSLAAGNIRNSHFDAIDVAGIVLEAAGGINGLVMSGLTISCLGALSSAPSTNNGIVVDASTGTFRDIKILNPRIYGPGSYGILVQKPGAVTQLANLEIVNPEIYAAGQVLDNDRPAIYVVGDDAAGTAVAAVCSKFHIKGGVLYSRNAAGSTTTDINYGIVVGRYCADFSIDGVEVRNAQTGGVWIKDLCSGYVLQHCAALGSHANGFVIGSTNTNFAVKQNTSIGHSGAVVTSSTTPNGTTAIVDQNYGTPGTGVAPAGEYQWIGSWHATNPGAGTAAFKMGREADGTLYFLAPFKGRAVGISLVARNNAGADTAIAANAGRTATATVQIDGSAGTLATTFTPDGTAFGSSNTQASGDTFAAGARLGVQLATGANWVAGDDVTVDLLIAHQGA